VYLSLTLPSCHLVILSLPAALNAYPRALLTAAALGTACATLSVIVVLRRWAFIGEGISHAGFGGIGTGWLLSLAFPALANDAAAYMTAILFCLAVALAIGYFTRQRAGAEPFGADSVIGIFLVTSVAWGWLALAIYNRRHAASPQSWEGYLFGSVESVSSEMMLAGVAVSAAVIFAVAALFKEILFYAFDPLMARVSGVRIGWIHYLLMMLLALVIVIGMRILGNFLIPALLVLPGATALLLSRRLRTVMSISVCVGLVGSVGGLILNHHLWPFLPSGPAIVLALFLQFLLAYAWSKIPHRAAA
jgi:ABC-type Mn2+/Zn2+ transport system permease subunit